MSQIRKLAGQTAIYGLSSIIGRLLNYLLVPFYTRVFNPAEYGVVSEFYAYVTFLIILYTFGMETAYFHFSNKDEVNEKVYGNSLLTLSGTSFLFSGVLLLFAQSIATALGYPHHPEYIRWFACILAFDALTAIPFARLRQLGRAKTFAGLKLLNIISNIALNIFFIAWLPKLAAHHPGVWSWLYDPAIGIGYVFIANLIASAVTFIFLAGDYRIIFHSPDPQLIKQMIVYAFPLLIAGFAGMINETLDRAILKYLVTDKSTAMTQLGIYSACYKLSILMTLFVQTFRYASEPFFFAQHKKDDGRQIYARVMNYFVFMCSVIMLGVLLYLDVVKIFIGKQFHSGLHIVPILLLANLCLGVYLNLSIWYKLTGQTRFGAWLSVFGASVTIAFNLWLIPKMGYTGAAWTTLICYALMMIFSYIKGQQQFYVPYQAGKMIMMVVSALLVWQLVLFIRSNAHAGSAGGLIINTVAFLVYGGLMWKMISEVPVQVK